MQPHQLLRQVLQPGKAIGFNKVVEGVSRMGVGFVNVYLVKGDRGWVLIDTAMPATGVAVRTAVEAHIGEQPVAILLTHGHFDHASNAFKLAEDWRVPVYAGPLEMPYLTGRSDYPPADPTPGGAICFLSRFFPTRGFDLGHRVHPLQHDEGAPAGGLVPHLPGWRWIATPGHTAGHVSFFRERDRTLIAGDALATMDMDSWSSNVTYKREISRPAVPFTPDWPAARRSVQLLAELEPLSIMAGHGLPMRGRTAQHEVRALADHLPIPPEGRYTHQPADYAADGAFLSAPPARDDPIKRNVTMGAAALGVAAAVLMMGKRKA